MADEVALELQTTGGARVRVRWRADALRALARGASADSDCWQLDGEVDWSQIEALRVVSAGFEDGSTLAVAAARPAGAANHGAEAVGALVGRAEGEPGLARRALVSTEYGPDGLVRRAGFELVEDPAEIPTRVAADSIATTVDERDGVRHEVATMEFRLEAETGGGLYEILRPG